MIDHTTLLISDFATNKENYRKLFAVIGYGLLVDEEFYAGFGKERPQFWIAGPRDGESAGTRAHIAISVSSKDAVNAFHATALELGWRDNGAPGPRPEYGNDYYASFVLDQDGNNLEALIREV